MISKIIERANGNIQDIIHRGYSGFKDRKDDIQLGIKAAFYGSIVGVVFYITIPDAEKFVKYSFDSVVDKYKSVTNQDIGSFTKNNEQNSNQKYD